MTNSELNALARQILDNAEVTKKAERGIIVVDPNLLFRYYLMRNMTSEETSVNP